MQDEATGSDENTPAKHPPRSGRRAIGIVAVASLVFIGATGAYAAIRPRIAEAQAEADRRA